MWPYFASLVALCAFTALIKDARAAATAAILLANWLLCTVVVTQTGDAYPWTWFFAVDYLSAFTILALLGRPTMWQGTVGGIYAAQLICHASRGLYLHSQEALYYGYYFLKWASWAQLGVVAAWGIYEISRGHWMFGGRASSAAPGSALLSRIRR